MRTILKLTALAIIVSFAFTSCKKDHVCTCTTTYSNGDPSSTTILTYHDATKKDAKKACIDRTEVQAGTTETTACELK